VEKQQHAGEGEHQAAVEDLAHSETPPITLTALKAISAD